jgi:hypothetical protein
MEGGCGGRSDGDRADAGDVERRRIDLHLRGLDLVRVRRSARAPARKGVVRAWRVLRSARLVEDCCERVTLVTAFFAGQQSLQTMCWITEHVHLQGGAHLSHNKSVRQVLLLHCYIEWTLVRTRRSGAMWCPHVCVELSNAELGDVLCRSKASAQGSCTENHTDCVETRGHHSDSPHRVYESRAGGDPPD